MLTSWNVNQFLEKESWDKLKGQESKKIEIWERAKDYYFSFIKNHILTKDDLLILHEVPFNKEDSERIVYKELEQFCADNEFEILPTPNEKQCHFKTVAIFKKGAYKTEATYGSMKFTDYANRIIAVEKVGTEFDEIIIGLHIPVACDILWNNVISLHKKLPKNKRIIYAGDFNTYISGTDNKNAFYKLLSEGLVDVWLEKGNPHTKETYIKKTSDEKARLDYILMTGKDFYERSCNINISVDDTVRYQGYSDHSALVLFQE